MNPHSYKSERATLAERAKASRTSMPWLSRALGRTDRYLSRFVAGGPPTRLTPADREWLSLFFGVSRDDGLGIPDTREWDA